MTGEIDLVGEVAGSGGDELRDGDFSGKALVIESGLDRLFGRTPLGRGCNGPVNVGLSMGEIVSCWLNMLLLRSSSAYLRREGRLSITSHGNIARHGRLEAHAEMISYESKSAVRLFPSK